MKILKNHPILKIINSSLIDMPSPSSINFYWNFGSLLGLSLVIQILTGFLLTMHYSPDITLAFSSIIITSRNIPNLYWIRWMHANGASLIFFLMYLHMSRNIYFNSFNKYPTWFSGMMIFTLMMITAFMGYVLPWGQMSYWGVTVITNLLSTIPYSGSDIVNWLWGGFSINNPTLKRFYSIHFLLPFITLFMIILHLLFLHHQGSSNPLLTNNTMDMIHFHPFFTLKDISGFMFMISLFFIITLTNPMMFMDPENFIMANPSLTPIHIQPEWYFLFAYAILRAIPNKVGGVIALTSSILILFFIPLIKSHNNTITKFHPLKKYLFWSFIMNFIMLTWLGMNPVTFPFLNISMVCSSLYFILIILYTKI